MRINKIKALFWNASSRGTQFVIGGLEEKVPEYKLIAKYVSPHYNLQTGHLIMHLIMHNVIEERMIIIFRLTICGIYTDI